MTLFRSRHCCKIEHICYYFNQPTPYRWTLTLPILCYFWYIWRSQDQSNRNYSRLLCDYITYSANNTGKRCIFVIYIYKGKCDTLIVILLRFGLSHRYNIQYNIEWLFLIVLNVVKSFLWDRSVLTQYSYYRDLFCSGPASRLRYCVIVGYSPTPSQQVSAILWNDTTTVWL